MSPKICIALAVALLAGGCASAPTFEETLAVARTECAGYGFTPESADWPLCVMIQAKRHKDAYDAEQAVWAEAIQRSGAGIAHSAEIRNGIPPGYYPYRY